MEKVKKIKIKRITQVENEDVYDISVKDNHNFFINNVLVHNCAELVLSRYDSCRLMAINLYSYVINPYLKNAYFDFEKFKNDVYKIQKLMDDLIDLEIEKIDKILEKIQNDPEDWETKNVEFSLWNKIRNAAITGRRTGLGVTAVGDMIAALNLQYGTRKATMFIENVQKTLAITAYKSSIDMAIERGHFSVWDYNLEKTNNKFNSKFLERIYNELDEEYKNKFKKTGRRNISILTIAPTGSLSLLTQTTSGIEPVFRISYKRRKKININDKNYKNIFTDKLGDVWEEYNIIHPKFIKWLKNNNYDIEEVKKLNDKELEEIIKVSPYYNSSACDIDWKEKVYMQGQLQKWVDHSISVTINLPQNVTKEVVSELYMYAWENRCKGITIYREGSRDGILISNKEKEEREMINMVRENHAVKRPKTINCEIIRFKNNKEDWIGFLGLVNESPYEIFTGRLESFPVPNYIKSGEIIKIKDENKISRYDFIYTDKNGYKVVMEGLNRSFNDEYWNYGKFTSGLLRHGMPILSLLELINSLKLHGEYFGNWKSGVSRMIKKYIKDETKLKDMCPSCNTQSLIYESGCVMCRNCGFSRC